MLLFQALLLEFHVTKNKQNILDFVFRGNNELPYFKRQVEGADAQQSIMLMKR